MLTSTDAQIQNQRRPSKIRIEEDHSRTTGDQTAALHRSVMENHSSARSNARHRIASPQQGFLAPLPPTSTPPPQAPHGGHNPFNVAEGRGPSWLASRNVLPPFAEQPRRAPRPPSRPSRVPTSVAGTDSNTQTRQLGVHVCSEITNAVERTHVQSGATLHATLPLRPFQAHELNSGPALPDKSALPLVRSPTAPPTFERENSVASGTRTGGSSVGAHRAGIAGASRSLEEHPVQWSDPSSTRSVSTTSDHTNRSEPRLDAAGEPVGPRAPGPAHAQSKRKRKGETMSMLIDTGFFPVEELIYGTSDTANQLRDSRICRVNLPPRLSLIEKDLPATPTTSTTRMTPTELLTRSPASPSSSQTRVARSRRSRGSSREPLSQISENRADNDGVCVSPTRTELAAIGEDALNEENVPPASDGPGPTATTIHLRGGSIVTVTPPEMSAWRIAVYLHGPIMLPKPSIAPRKNSVASLEPFQDAVDQLYQHSLTIPRRRSDDTVVDEICDFFDDFNFDTVMFDGDCLGISTDDLDETPELKTEPEPCGTSSTEASPIEVVVAQEVLHSISRLRPPYPPSMPPVETEETLRARGIARLSRASAGTAASVTPSSRKESLTLGTSERKSQAVQLPPVEGSIAGILHIKSSNLGTSKSGDGAIPGPRGSTRVHGEEEIEEISGGSTWVAPATASKRPSVSKGSFTQRSRRNPMDRFRRAVANASTVIESMDL